MILVTNIEHELYGNLIYEGYWIRLEKLKFWDKEKNIKIVIVEDEIPVFIEAQKDSYVEFSNYTGEFIRKAELSAYNYYLNSCAELRERFESDADTLAPIVSNEHDFAKLVTPTDIFFPRVMRKSKTLFAILFDCTWDPSHGLAVVFKNGEVSEVGEQDIIL